MKNLISISLGVICLVICCSNPVLSQAKFTIKPDLNSKGFVIPGDYSGIAYEISEIVPKLNGKYYFYPHNKPLVQMFRTLGLKTIRIGGNTADLGHFKFPDRADVDSLFQFARMAGVKVIYTLKLKNGSVSANTNIAKYIYTHYKNELYCLAIGNEPNEFIHNYPDYAAQWQLYHDTLAKTLPGVKFCGPNNTSNATQWPALFLSRFGHNNDVAFLAIHDYPGGGAYEVKDAVKGIDGMLSAEWLKRYEKFDKVYGISASASRVPFRIEEINSFYNGGARHVSDTYASALWSVDYLYWWAEHKLGGINFQNGDSVAAGSKLTPCKYASFVSQRNGYYARPSAYGMKLFDLGGHGNLIPTGVTDDALQQVAKDSLPVRAYSVLAGDGSLKVTVLNKAHKSKGAYTEIKILAGKKYHHCKLIYMQSADGTAAAESGITLGGSGIAENGEWSGRWSAAMPVAKSGVFTIKLKETQAVIASFSY